jgi:hypothetical protein
LLSQSRQGTHLATASIHHSKLITLFQRIGAVIKRRQKQRLADAAKLAQKEAMGDYSHLKNKKGELIHKPLPQPTLPNLSVDDDDDTMSMKTRAPPPSTYTQDYYYYNSDKNTIAGDYPPPMPAYNPYSTHQPPGSYAHFQQSSASVHHDDQGYHQHALYDDDNDSTAHLSSAAAPYGQQHTPIERTGSAVNSNQYGHTAGGGDSYDPHDVYQGRAAAAADPSRRRSPPSSGLAYDDPSSYSQSTLDGRSNGYDSGVSMPPRLDNPYGGYSSTPGTPQSAMPQQARRGRGYDEEGGGGGYSRAM